MARFGSRRKNKRNSIVITIIFSAVIIAVFMTAVRLVSGGNVARQEESLSRALENDITACYAMEGSYPESLDYIRDNYGLTYNENLFYVDYQVVGSNIRPVVTIIRKS